MIQIDLADAIGQATVRKLIETADVVVEPPKPFGVAEVRSLNPRAICLTLPGFCPEDERFADVQAAAGDFEACLLASLGVFTDMGLNRTLMGQQVSYSPLPLASAYSSALAAYSVVMALLSREDTGLGDAIEVPLAAGCMDALVSQAFVS
jgi:crotonobetainyl-CoA:carnitine CoA-transferase CaiB-like acyl-CoA transferase